MSSCKLLETTKPLCFFRKEVCDFEVKLDFLLQYWGETVDFTRKGQKVKMYSILILCSHIYIAFYFVLCFKVYLIKPK